MTYVVGTTSVNKREKPLEISVKPLGQTPDELAKKR
jgi:hypothetical protein